MLDIWKPHPIHSQWGALSRYKYYAIPFILPPINLWLSSTPGGGGVYIFCGITHIVQPEILAIFKFGGLVPSGRNKNIGGFKFGGRFPPVCAHFFLVSEGHVNLSGSALSPFVRYLRRAICYLLKQVLITVNLLSASCLDLQSLCTDVCTRMHECRSRNVGAWFIKH